MQRVEIIRALLTNPQLLILDEPTSVLTPQAVENLFVTLRKLAAEGCSILYISHKLHEIRELCTACTVLRGGQGHGRVRPAPGVQRLAEPPDDWRRAARAGAPRAASRATSCWRCKQLDLARDDQFGVDLHRIALQVRAGEVVGIAGVSGNGQKELLYALSGEDTRAAAAAMPSGAGKRRQAAARRSAARLGLHFVPEERLGRGAVPTLCAGAQPAAHAQGCRGHAGAGSAAACCARQAAAHHRTLQRQGRRAAARRRKSLSGGNLQKFIVGREIDANPTLLIVSQPTWGVDVGAAAQIRGEILKLRDAGCAVLVVSEELDELFDICDRLYVMAKGQLSPSLPRAEATVAWSGSG